MYLRLVLGAVAAAVLTIPAAVTFSQEAQPPAATPAVEEGASGEDILGGEDVDLSQIDQILRGEQEIYQGGVSAYDPAGRRDPFVSLLEAKIAEDEQRPRPPGLPGMMIEELRLEGIIQTSGGILAFVQGRDKISYIIRAGTRLFNGEVAEILPRKVVFKQQVNDPKQLSPYMEIVREIAD